MSTNVAIVQHMLRHGCIDEDHLSIIDNMVNFSKQVDIGYRTGAHGVAVLLVLPIQELESRVILQSLPDILQFELVNPKC